MPKPVCVKCALFFRPEKNGVHWVEGKPVGEMMDGKPVNGTWTGYKLWQSDLWECKGCGAEIIVGHALRPIAEDFQSGFVAAVAASNSRVQVNDC